MNQQADDGYSNAFGVDNSVQDNASPEGKAPSITKVQGEVRSEISQLWERKQAKLPEKMRLNLDEELNYLIIRIRQADASGGKYNNKSLADLAAENPSNLAAQFFSLAAAGISLAPRAGNDHAYVMRGTGAQGIRIAPSYKGLMYLAQFAYGARNMRVRLIHDSEQAQIELPSNPKEPPSLPKEKFAYEKDDKVVGMVAWATMPDGTIPYTIIDPATLEAIKASIRKLHGKQSDPKYYTQFQKSFPLDWLRKTAYRRLVIHEILNKYETVFESGEKAMTAAVALHDAGTDGWQKRLSDFTEAEAKKLVEASHRGNPDLDSANLATLVLADFESQNIALTRRQEALVKQQAQLVCKEMSNDNN